MARKTETGSLGAVLSQQKVPLALLAVTPMVPALAWLFDAEPAWRACC